MTFFDDITDENAIMGASFKEPNKTKRRYDQRVDYAFFEAHDIVVEEGKDPWIFFLRHPDLEGRFVWYPTTGTLVREFRHNKAHTVGIFTNSEDVYSVIMETINMWEE